MSPCTLFNFTPQNTADADYIDIMQDERPSRKLKSENRVGLSVLFWVLVDNFTQLYNFLTRSRSRSRPKDEPTPPPMSVSPDSKPVSRLPSRPLSSTTVTPKPRKQLPAKPLPPDPPSRPSTPKPSGARQKLHDLFGIPLGRKSSRSRSRSRPASPRSSLDVPPLPTDDDLTPRPRKSLVHSISRPRSPSPSPAPKVLRVTNATTTSSSTGSTAASIKISKFFAKSSSPPSIPDPNRTPKASATPHPGPPILPPMPSIVSAPIRRVSSLHRRSLKDPVIEPSSPPKIIHTPPTPLKNTPSNGSKSASARLGYHAAKASMDSGYRYRGATMSILDEEAASQKSKSKDAHQQYLPSSQPVPRPPGPIKMSSSARSTKHGSFDFERPGWGASIIQRTGSNGTSGTGGSRNDTQSKERESVYGPGLAGVGTLQREASVKRNQEREEMQRTKERARKAAQATVIADKEKDSRPRARASHYPTAQGSSTTPSEHVHGSTSTAGTGASATAAATGKSSSMSKATGRRHHGMKTASGSGISRLIGLTAQHGPFSFERPVPSPTWSTGTATSTGTVAHSEVTASWKGRKAEKERERVRDELERQRESRRGGARKAGDRAPVPVPSVLEFTPSHGGSGSNAGHRSGTKGRSLDLGLGLAWAPSKVDEWWIVQRDWSINLRVDDDGEVGRSASGNGRPRGQQDREVERSKLGKEVAEMFKNALDPEAFALFKRYAHQFDANQIPFDGPTGIVSLVEHLLVSAPHLGDEGKRCLLDKFVRVLLQQA
ncbi:hypothetical protein M413DRAFT_8225 [Hebeloma cylindrosporum]|uniref:Uncharacterized protein n=1 Tax=Hebeloma cylindrosporum TaxID=76867 RepID=A0A0C2Y920_HEBCY|nr:hypothetical protein M413DRAFT_8225 [Hebeloma cylindrosporum h7]